MFVSPAFAQGAGGGAGGSMLVQLLPIILIFVVFYFLLIRPQQRRAKEHRNMVQNLRRGDRVVTAGGLIGTVTKVVNDNEMQMEIAEGTRVRVVKTSVQEVLSKTEPAGGESGQGQQAANQQSGSGGGILGKLMGGGQQGGGQASSNQGGDDQQKGGQDKS
jgi:preprotein translocase subunit YajC